LSDALYEILLTRAY